MRWSAKPKCSWTQLSPFRRFEPARPYLILQSFTGLSSGSLCSVLRNTVLGQPPLPAHGWPQREWTHGSFRQNPKIVKNNFQACVDDGILRRLLFRTLEGSDFKTKSVGLAETIFLYGQKCLSAEAGPLPGRLG